MVAPLAGKRWPSTNYDDSGCHCQEYSIGGFDKDGISEEVQKKRWKLLMECLLANAYSWLSW